MIFYESQKLNFFEDVYQYNGYALVNDIYEDDEGFNKNGWMWGKVEGENIYNVKVIKGLSSNSYAPYSEAKEAFLKIVNAL